MKSLIVLTMLVLGVSANAHFNDKIIGQENNLAYICQVNDEETSNYLAQFQIKGFHPDSGMLYVENKDCESSYTGLIEEPYEAYCSFGPYSLKVAPPNVAAGSFFYSTEHYFGFRLPCERVFYAQTL